MGMLWRMRATSSWTYSEQSWVPFLFRHCRALLRLASQSRHSSRRRAGNAFSVLRREDQCSLWRLESHLLEANLYRDHLVLKSAEALAVMCDVAIQPQGT